MVKEQNEILGEEKKCEVCKTVLTGMQKKYCSNICKNRSKKRKEYNQKSEVIEKRKVYNRKPEIIERRKKYNQKPEVKEKREKYNQKPEVIKARKKQYRKSDRKRRKDPLFRMGQNISAGIRKSLKSNNLFKDGRHWEHLVGYTILELKEHLEKLFKPGMNFDNKGEWVIDHIIPKIFFKYKSIEDTEFKYCWSLDNLQPLWEKDNRKKWDKVILWRKEVKAGNLK